MKRVVYGLSVAFFAFIGIAGVSAQQHASDPAMQKAREETQVVLDFARFLGIVLRMVELEPALEFTREQARDILDVLTDVRTTSRLTATTARRLMAQIEDDVLTPQQLMFADRVWMQSSGERASGSGAATGGQNRGANSSGDQSGPGGEASTNAGALSSYIAGGPYNPLIDTTRRQGQDFEALYDYARARAER